MPSKHTESDSKQRPEDAKFVALLKEMNKTLPWRSIADLPDFRGVPWSTLAAYGRGRPIRNPLHRAILGLPPHETCGMCHTFKKYMPLAEKERRKRQPKRIRDFPLKSLRVMIENREEI